VLGILNAKKKRSVEHDPQKGLFGHRRWAGALVSKVGALGEAPFCLCFVPVASGVF